MTSKVLIDGAVYVFTDKLTKAQEDSVKKDPLVNMSKIGRGYIVRIRLNDLQWVRRHAITITMIYPATQLETETLHGQTIH